jgi:NAD(P)H-dependent FMN reductase
MNIVTVFGGPRLQGNTATVLGWVEDALREEGHSVERFNTSELEIKGCQGCNACAESMDAPGCVLQDDAGRIFEAMIRADAIVHASPLYMWSLSGQLKPFLDRTFCLVKDYGGPKYTSLVDGKRTTLLMTCMGPIERNAEWARDQFVPYADYCKYELIEPWIVPGCSTPDKLTADVRRQAAELAARLVA